MPLSYFEIERGFSHNGTQIIAGDGEPGLSGDSLTVTVGTIYQDFTNGRTYEKRSSGVGVDKWVELADKDYVDAALASVVTTARFPFFLSAGTASYINLVVGQLPFYMSDTTANFIDTVV